MKRLRGYRKLLLLLMIVGTSLVLSACGGIMTGRMEIDSAFAGSRTITCSVSVSELQNAVEGGVATVEEIVKEHCPNALKYSSTTAAGDLTYTFTISFHDADSYRNLILSILPDSQMELLVGDGKFSNGIRLKEDFTDHDLLQWFDDALLASGKYKTPESPIWEQTACALVVDGVTVSNYQPFSYDTYQGVTLRDVSVYTTVYDTGTLERKCVFEMSKEDYETAGDQFTKYLAARMPQDAESFVDEQQEDVTVHEVTFTAEDADALCEQTEQLFGDRGLFSGSVEPTSPFSDKTTYTEYLSFEAFPADAYHYYVKAADATENAGLFDGYGNAILLDNWLSYPVNGGELSISYTRHKSFSVGDIEVVYAYGADALEAATVYLNFTGLAAATNAQTASNWYYDLTSGSYPRPQLVSTANGVSCVANLSLADGSLQCLESWFEISRFSDTEVEQKLFLDRINILLDCDYTALMEQSGAKKITSTLKLPQGMQFMSVRQDGSAVRCEDEMYTIWNDAFTVSAKARVLRTDRIILAVLIGVLLVIVAILLAAAGIRLHLARKGGKEDESYLAAMKESVKACFSGRMPQGADKEGVRYFYGKRGPQILVIVGGVILPLVWSIVYLVCYERANSFYFFSGMLRYLSVTLFVLCALTVPAALLWRYYQKASADNEVGLRMAQKTAAMAKAEIARSHNRIQSEMLCLPSFDTALMVPDAFVKRQTLPRRMLCRLVRQFSRKFPDIERPFCVYLPGDKIAASRTLVQNILLIDGKLVITSALVNPAFETVTHLEPISIAIEQIKRFTREDTVLHAHYRDGLTVRTKRVVFTKATLYAANQQRYSFVLPKSADTTKQLETLSELLAVKQS